MKIANKHFGWMFSAMSLVTFTGGTALADDTELFLAGEDTTAVNSEARPNILFIIDTSGSMKSEVTTEVEYDPGDTYSGSYSSSRVYWNTTDSAPGSGTGQYFSKSDNNCTSAKDMMDGLGSYKGPLLEWRDGKKKKWSKLNTRGKSRTVECKDDQPGTTGHADSSYAVDGSSGPYSSSAAGRAVWTTDYYLFDGNYLNWQKSGGKITQTRLEIVQEVTKNLVDNITGVNVGLMRFNYDAGGPVVYAMGDVDTNGDSFKDAVSNLGFDGWTPLSETLYEAYLYYKGGKIDYGQGHTRNSVAASRVGGSSSSNYYNSPVDYACQKNYVIVMTDGEPTKDKGAQSKIQGLTNFKKHTGNSYCQRGAPYTGRSSEPDDGICLDELAEYMYKDDLSDFYGQQNVTTYTVGFTIDLDLLKTTAKKGGGEYYLANSTSTLASALTKITLSILDDATTFVAPVVPVNSFNRTQSLSDVYMSVFNPSSTVHWPGNLKKYKLVDGRIIDVNTNLAVDPNTGFFRDTAKSFWSDMVDGDQPALGGAADEIPDYLDRTIYTNLTSEEIRADSNRITLANMDVLDNYADVFGVDKDNLPELIKWVRGVDVRDYNDNDKTDDNRRQMGDAMHGSPVPVIYGGTAAQPDLVVYSTTNDGLLHAIDPDDGKELWAFLPKRLIPIQKQKMEDEVSARRIYGLDGQIKAHILNNDNVGGISAEERVILLFGMRRGGHAVYALDVTDREKPDLLWVIDENTPGFEDLGQTWSTPQVSKVRIGTDSKDVAMFGGGYDTGQDGDDYRTDSVGNAIYMVNLLTGEKIWSAGPDDNYDLTLSKMEHSIPAPLRLIDLNNDGYVDRTYVGDTGGRVWRFDFTQGNAADKLGQGGLVATLGAADLDSPTAADIRRFYNQVDAVNVQAYGNSYMALNLGSGYRAHPLDRAIKEEFFSVRDFNALKPVATKDYGAAVLRSQLIDITKLPNADIKPTDPGWRLQLVESPGEKNLSRSVTSAGVISFTTFSPGSSASACNATQGTNRVYEVNLLSGDPVYNRDGSEDADNLTEDDRFSILTQGGIVPGRIYITDGSKCDGLQCEPADIPPMPTRSYWTQDGAR